MLDYIAIIDLVRNHPFYATIVLGAGTILASEVIWGAIKFPMRKKKPLRVHQVVIFNELGQSCSSQHYRNIQSESEGMAEPDLQCDNPYCTITGIGKMVKQIDQAVYSIDVAIYTFTSFILCDAFKRAVQRGVTIRIISDREMVFSSGSQLNVLADLGVPVRGPVTTNLMHHKYLVIDGVERVEEIRRIKQRKWMRPSCSVLISGSVNWTRQGFGGNWENCIITSDPLLAHSFQAEFNRMWKSFEQFPDNITMMQSQSGRK